MHRKFRYIDLEKLRIFHAVATVGSFSAARKATDLSQPSVSGHVKDLERLLGLDLFERAGRGVRLTQAGENLFGYARQIFELEAEAGEALAAVAGDKGGRVRVSASSTPGTYLLPRLLGAFKKQNPSIDIDLSVTDSADALARVLDRSADIGVMGSLSKVARSGQVSAQPWVNDELVLIAPNDHPWCKKPPRRAASLGDGPFLMREAGSSVRALTEEWLDGKGIQVDVAMELGNPEAIMNAVRAGLGVSIISRHSIREDGKRDSVRVIEVPGLPIRRRLHVVAHGTRRLSGAAALLKEMILAHK